MYCFSWLEVFIFLFFPWKVHNGVVVRVHCSAGAPGSTNSTFLNGMSFVEGWEQNIYISKWSMHQLVHISYLSSGFVP